MKRTIYIILAIITITGLVVYAWLGGFSSPEISAVRSGPFFLAGKEFRGLLKSDELTDAFNNADSLQKLIPGSDVAALFYNDTQSIEDTLSGFIGVVVPDTTEQLSKGIEYRHLPEREVLETQMNYLIVPPDIYNHMNEYAEENDIDLGFPVLEIYPGDKQIKIQAPILK